MSFQLTFEVDGDVQLSRSFSRWADDVKDLKGAFEQIAKDFHQVVEKKQFESQGSYGSGGWVPLNPAYAEWKARNFPGKSIMVLSGLLKESLLGDNPWSIKDIQPLEMRLGTRLKYAVYHQRGTRKTPRRPVVELTESDKTRWTKIIHRQLVDQAKEAGLL